MVGRSVQGAAPRLVTVDLEAPARIHLDANANAPVMASVQAAIIRALDAGNPSSAHGGGEDARVILTEARDAVAALCEGLFPEDVTFTSGCTEANNTIVATARAMNATLITSAVEHPSVLRPAKAFAASGGDLRILPVDRSGQVDLHKLLAELAATQGQAVVSIQAANSETGVLQPLDQIAAIAAARGDVLVHSDAAQAFGRVHLAVGQDRGPHVLSVSAHKLHGPMGVGALLSCEGEARVAPLLLGGDQERGLRAGTEPLPLIAGFGAACRARADAFEQDVSRMGKLRDRLEHSICEALPGVVTNCAQALRLPNTSNLQFADVDAMSLIALLDADGVLASQGSACHNRRPEPSHVLLAIGLTEAQAFSSVRFSLSASNTEADIDAAVPLIVAACHRLGLGA
jgi:cysteine desulfurase